MKLAWSLFVREWRAGELRLAAFALVLAVAAVTGVGFVQDRVERGLLAGAAQLSAGDLIVASDRAPPEPWLKRAELEGLSYSVTAGFPSMLRGPVHSVLASVRAVSPHFPLRGALRLQQADGSSGPAVNAPAPGSAYLAPGLAARLGLTAGMPVELGKLSLRPVGILADEPDAGLTAFRLAPRLMIAESDLSASGLLREGSRVNWRLALSGPADGLQRWRAAIAPQLAPGERFELPADTRPEVRSLIDQAGQFLRLSALASVLLASIALLFALRRHIARQRDTVAILRCLGASRGQVLKLQLWCLVFLGLGGVLAGLALGLLLQMVLAAVVAPLVGVPLPAPGLRPALAGVVTVVLLLPGLALPDLFALLRVPALRVLRQDLLALPGTAQPAREWLTWLSGGAALALVAWASTGHPLNALFALATLLLIGGLAAGLVRLLLAVLLRVSPSLPLIWRHGLRSLRRQPGFTSLQAGALAVGLMVMLLLGLVREDLLRTWQSSIPPNAPNHFIIGIQADERAPLAVFLRQRGFPDLDVRPLIRARLVTIDGQPVHPERMQDARARGLVDREFNLSWAAQPNPDNHLVQGAWWEHAPADAGFSLEKSFADRLDLHVGSRLGFDIAGIPLVSRVASIRTVRWDSFQPNFFVLAKPGLLDESDTSYIASFRIEPSDHDTADALVAAFPQVSLIDTGALLSQVRSLTAQVALAIELVFGFSLVAGLAVLLAGIQATHDERLREGALLRALGATSGQLRTLQAIEFGVMGAAAGLAAAFGALLASWGVSHWLLDLPWQLDWRLPVLGSALGLLIVGAAATMSLRQLTRAVPAESLRLFT